MKPVKIPGFSGINNRAPIDRLPRDESGLVAVRDAVNVDLTAQGTFQRRPGVQKVQDGDNCRSLRQHGNYALYADGAKLRRFDGSAAVDVADLGSSVAHVAFASTPLGLAWSDGYTNNLLTASGSSRLTPDAPNPMPSVEGLSGGALEAGSYGVCVAAERADGLRSELSSPSWVVVPASGRVVVTLPAAQSLALAVFVTACDGSTFYRSGTIPAGATAVTIPIQSADGEPIVWESTGKLPPGDVMAYANGRLFTASGPMVYHSMPFNLGLYRPAADFVALDAPCTMLAEVEGGMFVATAERTWFLPGDIADTRMTEVAPFGAIKGTLTTVPNSKDVLWFSDRGPVRASPAGEIALLQDGRIAFNPGSVRGAGVFRETNGLRQYLASLSAASPTGAAVAGSYMDAEVIKP